MTDTEINIAIADACGWIGCRYVECLRDTCGTPPASWNGDRIYDTDDAWTPKYCNDLNAMHEAIAFLNPEEADWFAVELSAIVLENPSKAWWDMNSNEVAHIANATARQRAEAFLRTIGKWEEVQP